MDARDKLALGFIGGLIVGSVLAAMLPPWAGILTLPTMLVSAGAGFLSARRYVQQQARRAEDEPKEDE